MDLLPSQDQQDIAAASADFLSNELPISGIRARANEASSVDEKAWKGAAALGLFGLGLPESAGGAACGLPEEALLFREVGRHLASGPFLSTVLAGHVAHGSGDPALAERIAQGTALVGLATVTGAAALDGGPVSGRLQLHDWAGTDYLLLASEQGAGLIETSTLGAVRSAPSIDPGVRIGSAQATGLDFTHWLPAAERSVYLRGLVLVAAQLVGIAEACRDESVEYAKTREQFGRPIGVHQAIKHRCADMAVAAEGAMAQLYLAAASCESNEPDAEFQVRSARIVAARAAHANATTNVQIHGGIGFTSEFDAHLYVERVEVLEHVLDGREHHLAAIIELDAPQ
jgi:alkylation response protein AidB-like acyl-CoA dehydrogenase